MKATLKSSETTTLSHGVDESNTAQAFNEACFEPIKYHEEHCGRSTYTLGNQSRQSTYSEVLQYRPGQSPPTI